MSNHDIFQLKTWLSGSIVSKILIIFLLSGLNIQLYAQEEEQIFEIDSVVIRARQESRNLMEKPYTEPKSLVTVISKISRQNIRKQGSTNVIDALNYIPGGLTETRGRQVKQFFSVRGQKYPYPDYAIDGVWQKEFEELPYFFSTSDIEEIEIVRSSAALLTGLSGLAGLINIKTREYTSSETNLEMEYGSYNNFHSHLSNGNKIGNFSYSAGIGYDKNDGPEGKHAKEEMLNFSSQLKWQPTEKLSVKGNIFFLEGSRELRIAEEPADSRYQAMIQNFDPIKALLTNLRFIYRPTEKLSSELQVFYTSRNPTFNDEVKMTSSNEKDSEWGFNFIQSVSLSKLNILRFGGLYNHWVAPNGKRFYTGKRCDTETFSGVVVDEHRIGRLTIDAGFRITGIYVNDYGAFNIEGDGAPFRNVTPVQDEWQEPLFQGSLGASFRMNNIFSIYINSTAGQIKPRPGSMTTDFTEPENEDRYKLDLGIETRFAGTGKMTLTAFGVIQNDAIVLSGETYVDTLTNITRELYINRDQNQWGLEFEIFSPELYRFIKPFMNFTLMKSKLEASGEMIRNKENPVFISSGGLYMEKRQFDVNIFGKYVSAFENDRFANPADGPQPLGDFFTIDLNGGYTAKGRMPVRFYFRIRNLTDARYSTVIGYPDFGRMFFGGIQIKFQAKSDIFK